MSNKIQELEKKLSKIETRREKLSGEMSDVRAALKQAQGEADIDQIGKHSRTLAELEAEENALKSSADMLADSLQTARNEQAKSERAALEDSQWKAISSHVSGMNEKFGKAFTLITEALAKGQTPPDYSAIRVPSEIVSGKKQLEALFKLILPGTVDLEPYRDGVMVHRANLAPSGEITQALEAVTASALRN